MKISFVDENEFVKEGKWYFIEREFTVGNKLYTMRMSGKIDVRFRLML